MRGFTSTLVALALSTSAGAETQIINCPAPRGAANDGAPYQAHTFVLTNVTRGDPSSELRRKVRVAGWRTISAEFRASRLLVEAERDHRFDTVPMKFVMSDQYLYSSSPVVVEIDYCASDCVTRRVTCTSSMNYR